MAYQLWMQDNFSKGELSPYMYARVQVNQYYDGLKIAQNVLTYPTGATGKRFGTLYQSTLSGLTSFDQLFFQTFQYLDECIYQIVITPLLISIYLEGLLVATVVTTFDAQSVYNLYYTILGATFRLSGEGFKPYDLTRSANSPQTISGFNPGYLIVSGATYTIGQVLPVKFTNSGGTLPTSNPQIKVGITYFINPLSAINVAVYSTAYNAKFNIDPYVFSNAGTGTNSIILQNTWSFAHSFFKNLPVYDFNGVITSYDALTFTPSATVGAGVTITVSGSGYTPLDSSYVGGAFIGAGGTSRITAVASATSFTVSVENPFDSVNPIQGSLTLLAEPAWSDARGWPQKCSSYQNRALFANTASLPNGFYGSVVNAYTDFGDLTTDDDDAISWYPTSNDVNVIRFIVPFRSITVHTNSGIYSSPLSEIAAITPTTFTLQLQDSTPADVLQPQSIDNQIIVLSGNDVHTMLWDGINNAYTSNIVSIVNEQTIRTPVDEAAFADLTRAGSRYVFIINSNGSMAVYQTLLAEQVSGFTPQIMEQSYGSAQFLQVASSFNGRCWFIVQRQQASALSPITITGFTIKTPTVPSTLTAVASNFDMVNPTAVTFTTTGSLPISIPSLKVLTYYWAIGVTADTFNVYLSQSDALANVNAIPFTSAGINSHVISWPLVTIFTLEELTQDVHLDCAVQYGPLSGNPNPAIPTDTIMTGALFNAQAVKMIGDGFGFDAIGVNNQIVFESHGATVDVSLAYIGFPINTIMEPMPIAAPPGPQTSLTKPKHIRTARFMFNNTIGGTINGVPIALEPFSQADIGLPPIPARGTFEMSIMQGWDDFNLPTFTIEHNEPFNIELIGVSYGVDI